MEATYNKNEKLDRIKAKCQEIIALGERRTQGRWYAFDNVCRCDETDNHHFIKCDSRKTSLAKDEANAAFIAACAGPAEAMAKSTLAAIEGLSGYANNWNNDNCLSHILAAWPEEIL